MKVKKIFQTLCLFLPFCLYAQTLPKIETTVITDGNGNPKYLIAVNTATNPPDTVQLQSNSKNRPLWKAKDGGGVPSIVEPTIEITFVENGYDIKYVFQNTTEMLSSIGEFPISGFILDQEIFYRAFNPSGSEMTTNHLNKKNFDGPQFVYPSGLWYSPVYVLGDDVYTIGISFKYPVIKYKHSVFMKIRTPSMIYEGLDSIRWEIMIEANSGGNQTIYESGHLAPDSTRTYEISVRFNYRDDNCNPWITTLEPYKNYFKEQYGQVTYQREADPVFGYVTAQKEYQCCENNRTECCKVNNCDRCSNCYSCGDSNPYGFKPDNRIDSNGFAQTAALFIGQKDSLYQRTMLWTPTGMYFDHCGMNYPFKFTSHWNETDFSQECYVGHKMDDAIEKLKTVTQNDMQLGLWWGRAGTVMTTWDANDAENLDPTDPVHVAKAYTELDSAIRAGTTLIGLDALTADGGMTHWDAYRWLDSLRHRAPNIKFIKEQGSADFLHTKAAFYYNGNLLQNEHYLSNYLLPGTEIWARNPKSSNLYNREEFFEEFARLTGLGYVTVNTIKWALDQPYLAKETWYETNPYPDLGPDRTLSAGVPILLNASYYNHDTFTWYKMGLAGVLGTDSVLSISTVGTYYVITTNIYGCSFSDTVVVTMPSSSKGLSEDDFSEEKQSLSFSIFPNPGKKEITIENKTGSNIKSVALMDTQGKELFYEKVSGNKGLYIINVSDYSSGIYLIQVEANDGTLTKKKIVLE